MSILIENFKAEIRDRSRYSLKELWVSAQEIEKKQNQKILSLQDSPPTVEPYESFRTQLLDEVKGFFKKVGDTCIEMSKNKPFILRGGWIN